MNGRYLAIDLGTVNYAAVVNNVGEEPFLLSSRDIESEIGSKQCELNTLNWKLDKFKKNGNKESYNKTLEEVEEVKSEINDLRYRRDNFEYLATAYIVHFCVDNQIETIICGRYLEENRNLEFKHIQFFRMLGEIAERNNIELIEVDEQYTSGTSFLDNEEPIKGNYNKRRRVIRDFFKSKSGTYINADVNAAYQIMRKYDTYCFEEHDMRWFIVPRVVDFNELS